MTGIISAKKHILEAAGLSCAKKSLPGLYMELVSTAYMSKSNSTCILEWGATDTYI